MAGDDVNIALLTNQLDVGGIETNLVGLAAALTKRGHAVVALSRGGALVGELQASGAEHVHLRLRLRQPQHVIEDVRRLRRLIADRQLDVIHAFSATTAVVAWLGARCCRQRPAVVSSIMGLQTSPDEAVWRIWLRAWLTSLGADRMVIMAPAIERVARRLPVRRRRFAHLSVVGVDVPALLPGSAERSAARMELGLAPTDSVVTTIGRLDPSKSHELVVRAARPLLEVAPSAVVLIVGEGASRTELEQEIAALDLAERVRLLGERRDIDRILMATDVYVRPGVVEGFIGITVLEAQALAVPVVAFETEDVKLAITDDVTGVLVPTGDSRALACAIAKLLEHPERAKAIAHAGRQMVQDRFSRESVVKQVEDLYTDVSSASRRGHLQAR